MESHVQSVQMSVWSCICSEVKHILFQAEFLVANINEVHCEEYGIGPLCPEYSGGQTGREGRREGVIIVVQIN